MSWMITKEKLDETQRNIVSAITGQNHNLFIHGPAGSGKSVILVHALQDYLTRNRSSRLAIISFTLALLDLYKTGIHPDLLHRIDFFTMEGFKQTNINHDHDFLIIDEVQDSEMIVLDKLQQSGRKIITTGDFFQSIYLNKCNITDIRNIDNMQEPKLQSIYRNTKTIRSVASFFAEFPDEYRSFEVSRTANDTSVQLAHFSSKVREVEYTWKQAKFLSERGLNAVIILPNQKEIFNFCSAVLLLERKNLWPLDYNKYNRPNYDSLNSHFKKNGLPIRYLGNGYGGLKNIYDENLVTVMNYHSAKGMDFDAVFLPGLTNKIQLWGNPDIARRLFFVALTRSRQELYISYYNEPHEFIRKIPEKLLHITSNPIASSDINHDEEEEEIDDIFSF